MRLLIDTHTLLWFCEGKRLVIAKAQVEGLTIVTRDEDFQAYGVPLLW